MCLVLAAGGRLGRGDDAGALLDFNKAVELSKGGRGEYFVQRARARARVAMRSEGREEAMAGVEVLIKPEHSTKVALYRILVVLSHSHENYHSSCP